MLCQSGPQAKVGAYHLSETTMTALFASAQVRSILSRLEWRRFDTPFNRLMCLFMAIVIPVEVLLAMAVHLRGVGELLDIWPAMILLFVCLGYCVLRPLPRLLVGCELAIWAVPLTEVLSLLIQVSGRSPRPLVDSNLNAIDARMHFSTAFVVHLAARAPLAQLGLTVSYSLVQVLVIAAILAPPFFGHPGASRRFVLGIVFAAVVTAGLTALWPAIGPWTTEGLVPTKQQAAVAAYLMRLKSSSPVDLDMIDAGIVSFPSFHVVLAILSATALASIRRLRGWVWALAGLICISTITTGWHFGIDVIGGLVLAILTIAVLKGLEGRCF
jgi:membrane-associated phospholipid phosphatase